MPRGRFLTVEGGEGAGKSTQVRRLAAALESVGWRVLVTREPGGSPGAEAIRSLLVDRRGAAWSPMTEALLHSAARRDHLDHAVLPALARGDCVVCDRFADSTTAYQGYAQGLGHDEVAALHAWVLRGLKPDLTILLDIDVEAGLGRARARSPEGDRYERMDGPFHARVRAGFLEIARREPDRCVVVDADRPEDAVAADIRRIVVRRFPELGTIREPA